MPKNTITFYLITTLCLSAPLLAQNLYVPPNILIRDSFEAHLVRPELALDSVAETSTRLMWQSVADANAYRLFYATTDFATLTEANLDGLTDFATQHNGGSHRSYYTANTLYNLPSATAYPAITDGTQTAVVHVG